MLRGLIIPLLLAAVPMHAQDEIPTRDVLAAVLVLEAGGEGWVGMQAVANVIHNRAGVGKDLRPVLLKPRQFSSLNGRSLDRSVGKAMQSRVWPVAWLMAGQCLEGDLRDVTGGATHFYSGRKRPSWASKLTTTRRIGGHLFLK